MIKGIVDGFKEKYSMEGYDLSGKSTFRLKEDHHNKFRKFISGDEKASIHADTTVGKKLPTTARQEVQHQTTSPFLDDITEILSSDSSELYTMLLLQAMQLEEMVHLGGY